MYYVHDLYTDAWQVFESREDLVIWWKSHLTPGFEELNVTGKDLFACKVFCGYESAEDGAVYPDYIYYGPVLRRYQVFDDEFRSIDIRQWPESVWRAAYKPKPFCWSGRHSGRKMHRHVITGPAMMRSTSRQDTDCVNYDELKEAGLPAPERDRTAIRRKVLLSSWDCIDYIEDGLFRKNSKSWKDQYKSRKQWGKHRHIPRIPREMPESSEELAMRLEEELVQEDGFGNHTANS